MIPKKWWYPLFPLAAMIDGPMTIILESMERSRNYLGEFMISRGYIEHKPGYGSILFTESEWVKNA